MIDKANLIVQLVNFASVRNPMTAREIYAKFKQPGETLEDYQRQIAKMVREIQEEQERNASLGKPTKLIFSSNGGYYVAQNRKEAEQGFTYYKKKVDDMLVKLSHQKKLIDKVFPLPEQGAMFE